jgi:uncharacterized protein (TIGR02453 family)
MPMNFINTLDFLKKLARNNNREWFEKNKSRYLEIKDDFEVFVTDVLQEMITFDESLAGLNPKKLTFRIYRDVRFSKDKTPYKTNVSAGISTAGKGMGVPGYYFQIQPGNNSMVAVGMYQPSPENLAKIRQEIDYNGEQLVKILGGKKFKKTFVDLWKEDTLKTMPKGYSSEHPNSELLKLKSFMVLRSFKDTEVTSKKFQEDLLDTMKTGKSLNDFLTEGLA